MFPRIQVTNRSLFFPFASVWYIRSKYFVHSVSISVSVPPVFFQAFLLFLYFILKSCPFPCFPVIAVINMEAFLFFKYLNYINNFFPSLSPNSLNISSQAIFIRFNNYFKMYILTIMSLQVTQNIITINTDYFIVFI